MDRSIKKAVAALVLAGSVIGTGGTVAQAAPSSVNNRTSGVVADVSWIQKDGTRTGSELGNTHVGWLNTRQSKSGETSMYMYIEDFDCGKGETPYGDERGRNGCDWVGQREGVGTDDLSVTINGKGNRARITGSVTMMRGGGHGGGETEVLGTPAVDITLVASGAPFVSKGSYQYRNGKMIVTETYKNSTRQAKPTGSIGPMGFDIDLSSANFGTYKSVTTESRIIKTTTFENPVVAARNWVVPVGAAS